MSSLKETNDSQWGRSEVVMIYPDFWIPSPPGYGWGRWNYTLAIASSHRRRQGPQGPQAPQARATPRGVGSWAWRRLAFTKKKNCLHREGCPGIRKNIKDVHMSMFLFPSGCFFQQKKTYVLSMWLFWLLMFEGITSTWGLSREASRGPSLCPARKAPRAPGATKLSPKWCGAYELSIHLWLYYVIYHIISYHIT